MPCFYFIFVGGVGEKEEEKRLKNKQSSVPVSTKIFIFIKSRISEE